jgi:hypothetical protein
MRDILILALCSTPSTISLCYRKVDPGEGPPNARITPGAIADQPALTVNMSSAPGCQNLILRCQSSIQGLLLRWFDSEHFPGGSLHR